MATIDLGLSNGFEELTMKQFEELNQTEYNSLTNYDLLDYPVTTITNAQMTFALTCQRLFPEYTSFICADNGTYIQGYTYQIQIVNGVKTWVQITGRKSVTMEEYEGLASAGLNIDYDITNYPVTTITNAQMTFALTCQKLFIEGEAFICSDSGIYTQGVLYKIVRIDGQKQWQVISSGGQGSGVELQVDFDAFLATNDIQGSLHSTISNFEFENNHTYLFHIYLGLNTLTGELEDDYTITLKDKNGNDIHLNCMYQKDITKTSTVFDFCGIQDFDPGVGYSWEFRGHYREVVQNGQTIRVIYTTDITRESNPSMTGAQIAKAINASKLKPGTTALCTKDYNVDGVVYTKKHTYLVVGDFTSGELLLTTEDITIGG